MVRVRVKTRTRVWIKAGPRLILELGLEIRLVVELVLTLILDRG
jgi:hypothetical protein